MTLPKSVLDSAPESAASAVPGVLAEFAALALARARVLPRVCADGPLVFCAVEVLLLPLPDWPLPLAAPVPWAEPLPLFEPVSLAGLAAALAFGSSATVPADGAAARG